jgi:hypothetical protein
MRVVVIGALAAGLAVSAGRAQEVHRWVPIDRITMGVTGDITVSGDRLTFGNGASLKVKLLASHRRGRWSATNDAEEADIYQVDPPASPVVLRDNPLCDKPVTFVVLSYPVPHDAYLSVYTGPEPPKGDGSDQACSGFSYTEG